MKRRRPSYDPNYVPKRPKPFTSKQTRGDTGRKLKPGKPSQIKVAKGPQQFYFRSYVFQTKKELRDRIKYLLLSYTGAGNRPPPPGGLKGENVATAGGGGGESGIITLETHPHMYGILCELVQHHPNYVNWGNKCIEKFKVIRAPTRKRPPILLGTFKGNDQWRDLDWMKLVYKRDPTPLDRLYSAMWNAVRPQLAPSAPVNAKQSVPCERCGHDRLHIDQVRPSHARPFHEVVVDFLATSVAPLHFEWVNRDNSFRFRPCDVAFESAWQTFHATASNLRQHCETCRIEDWITNPP